MYVPCFHRKTIHVILAVSAFSILGRSLRDIEQNAVKLYTLYKFC